MRPFRRLLFAIATLCALACSSGESPPLSGTLQPGVTPVAGPLVGGWIMTQTTPDGRVGTTTLDLHGGGRYDYQVTYGGESLREDGSWTATSSQLSLTPDTCARPDAGARACPAVYDYLLEGNSLKLTYRPMGVPPIIVTLTRR